MKVKTTSDRLKELMGLYNLKQVDILEKCKPYCEKYNEKINKSHLSQWISGTNLPNQHKLTILSLALGVQETWLMGYDVPMKKELNAEQAMKDFEILNTLTPNIERILLKIKRLDDEKLALLENMIDSWLN